MKNNIFEITAGTVVLLCAIFFLSFLFHKSDLQTDAVYEVMAHFDNAEGIAVGSDVKISGVKVGSVSQIQLNKNSYEATLVIDINNDIKLPIDSSAKISSSGLLGGKFVAIEIGSEEEKMIDGDDIEFTQSSVNFEELLGKFIFSSKNAND